MISLKDLLQLEPKYNIKEIAKGQIINKLITAPIAIHTIGLKFLIVFILIHNDINVHVLLPYLSFSLK